MDKRVKDILGAALHWSDPAQRRAWLIRRNQLAFALGATLVLGSMAQSNLADLDPGAVAGRARAWLREGKPAEAEKAFDDALALAGGQSGKTNPLLGDLFHHYGDFLCFEERKPGPATVQYRNALPIRRLGPYDKLMVTLLRLGSAMHQSAGPAEAEPYLREALGLFRQTTGPNPVRQEDRSTLGHLGWELSQVLRETHRLDEAEKELRGALQVFADASRDFPRDPFMAQEHALSQRMLGDLLDQAGHPEEALQAIRQAVALHEKALADFPDEEILQQRTIAVHVHLANQLSKMQRYGEAENACRAALLICSNSPPVSAMDCAMAAQSLVRVLGLENKPAEAASLLVKMLAGAEPATDQPDPALQGAAMEVSEVARGLSRQGKAAEAEKLLADLIGVAQRKFGATNAVVGELFHACGDFLFFQEKKPGAATVHYLKALPIRRLAPDDKLCWTLQNLANATRMSAGPKEAEPYLREALQVYHRLHQGEDLNNTVMPAILLADGLYQQQRLPEAEAACRTALAACAQCGSAGMEAYANTVRLLMQVLKAEYKLAEGERLCREILAQRPAAATNDNRVAVQTLSALADILYAQGRMAEAEGALREALRRFPEPTGPAALSRWGDRVDLAHLQWQFSQILRETRQLDEAEKVLRESVQVLARASQDLPQERFLRLEHAGSEQMLGELLEGAGRRDKAAEAMGRSVALLQSALESFPDDEMLQQRAISGRIRLADLLAALGKHDDAEEVCRAALLICSKRQQSSGDCAVAAQRLERFLSQQKGTPNVPSTNDLWDVSRAVVTNALLQPAVVRVVPPVTKPVVPELKPLIDELALRAVELRPGAPVPGAPPGLLDSDPSQFVTGQFLVRLAVATVAVDGLQSALRIADQIAEPVHQQRARLELAEQLDRKGQTTEASRLRATVPEPFDPVLPMSYARNAAYESLQAEQLEDARAHLDRALALAPTSWPILKGETVCGFGRVQFEIGQTNEGLATVAEGVDLMRPFLRQGQNVRWHTLRDTAEWQAQKRDGGRARTTADLILDPEQWASAHVLTARAQIGLGDLEGARRSLEALLAVAEKRPPLLPAAGGDPGKMAAFQNIPVVLLLNEMALMSAGELGTALAKTGQVLPARQVLNGTLRRLRKPDHGDQAALFKRFEEQVPVLLARGLIEGRRFDRATDQFRYVRNEADRQSLQRELELARVEAGEGPAPAADSERGSAVVEARSMAQALKAAKAGQGIEAMRLAERLPPAEVRTVSAAVVHFSIQSDDLAQAQRAIQHFPLSESEGPGDSGIEAKAVLLQQLAKAQAERKLTNDACASLREAADLCQKPGRPQPWSLVKIIPELALLGDAEGALNALQSASIIWEIAPATGAALARNLGPTAAIRLARAQSNKDVELFLLLGVVEQMAKTKS